jgi:hypothetical protein
MERRQIWDEFEELPPEAQRQVIDFIAFLKTRHKKDRAVKNADTKLSDEPFIGMWKDREDMQDSSRWVRSLRKSEW